tara:strand:+ start:5047 stop:7068 length:2022 start_codon:yes stop_codon:yes gene_type:complete
MKNLFQMMSTPKKDNLWEGIQGYQDGGLLNMMPPPNEEDIINVNYLGRPESELQGLATEAFGRERNPLTQMLMRSESAAQAGDERRVADALQRSKGYNEQLLDQEIADIYSRGERRDARAEKFDKLKSGFSDFLSGLRGDRPTQAEMNLEDMASEAFSPDSGLSAENWVEPTKPLRLAFPDMKIPTVPEDIRYATEQNQQGKTLDPAMMRAMPAAPDMTNIMDVAAVTPEMKRPALNDMLLGSLIGAGRSGALAAGQGIKKGIDLAGEGIGAAGTGIGYGIRGTGKLLSALAGIPGDIAKAYQSYGEGERYPALAQLMSASQGKVMPNIYAGLYADGGEIKGYPFGGVVEDEDDPYGLGNINPGNPWAGWSAGNPPPAPPTPGAPPAPGTTYQSGQPMGSQDYMGSDVSYGSMFGVDTGAASSLDQALSNLGYELTPEQRKMYEEYDMGTAEKDIRLGGQRGLLGLTQQRQQQAAGSGFAGGGGGSATGTARRDLLQDISMQQRGRRQDYQEGIASQIAADIASGANIGQVTDPPSNTDVLSPEEVEQRNADPNWNPPPSPTDGATYNWNNQEMVWSDEEGDWVTRWDYDMAQSYSEQSDLDDFTTSDIRVKKDINYLFTLRNNVPIYTYKYKWSDDIQIGTMAQDIEGFMPDAVGERNGIKTVNYNKVFNRN